MIPVTPAAEPADFDSKVRQRGLSAIDEMVGRAPRRSHPGPRRAKAADREQDIPAGKFPPLWRDALHDMLVCYERRCAFLCLYLEHATGNPSVDHMLPKSRRWDRIYEWENYRLCAARINASKQDAQGIVDPFECGTGWFALEFTAFQVTRGPGAPASQSELIDNTLPLLNAPDCRRAREEYATAYWNGHISLPWLETRAPFVALELRRQGRLNRP